MILMYDKSTGVVNEIHWRDDAGMLQEMKDTCLRDNNDCLLIPNAVNKDLIFKNGTVGFSFSGVFTVQLVNGQPEVYLNGSKLNLTF